MSTIVITRPDSAEMKSLKAYLAAQGYHVVSPPENCRLWDEAEIRAFASACPDDLSGVVHPAPPPFQCSLEKADEETVARARDEGPLAGVSQKSSADASVHRAGEA